MAITKKDISVLISLYDKSLAQSNHEGDLIWQKFSAFIVTHAIFLALIGQIFTNKTIINPILYIRILSGVGFIFSILWFISTIRGYDTLEYWKSSAIELASKIFLLLDKKEYILKNYYKRGYEYFMEYDQVDFDYGYLVKGNNLVKRQRSCISKYLKFINTRRTAYLTIVLIIVLYVLIFFLLPDIKYPRL